MFLTLLFMLEAVGADYEAGQKAMCEAEPACRMETIDLIDPKKNAPSGTYERCECLYLCVIEPENKGIQTCNKVDFHGAFLRDG